MFVQHQNPGQVNVNVKYNRRGRDIGQPKPVVNLWGLEIGDDEDWDAEKPEVVLLAPPPSKYSSAVEVNQSKPFKPENIHRVSVQHTVPYPAQAMYHVNGRITGPPKSANLWGVEIRNDKDWDTTKPETAVLAPPPSKCTTVDQPTLESEVSVHSVQTKHKLFDKVTGPPKSVNLGCGLRIQDGQNMDTEKPVAAVVALSPPQRGQVDQPTLNSAIPVQHPTQPKCNLNLRGGITGPPKSVNLRGLEIRDDEDWDTDAGKPKAEVLAPASSKCSTIDQRTFKSEISVQHPVKYAAQHPTRSKHHLHRRVTVHPKSVSLRGLEIRDDEDWDAEQLEPPVVVPSPKSSTVDQLKSVDFPYHGYKGVIQRINPWSFHACFCIFSDQYNLLSTKSIPSRTSRKSLGYKSKVKVDLESDTQTTSGWDYPLYPNTNRKHVSDKGFVSLLNQRNVFGTCQHKETVNSGGICACRKRSPLKLCLSCCSVLPCCSEMNPGN